MDYFVVSKFYNQRIKMNLYACIIFTNKKYIKKSIVILIHKAVKNHIIKENYSNRWLKTVNSPSTDVIAFNERIFILAMTSVQGEFTVFNHL